MDFERLLKISSYFEKCSARGGAGLLIMCSADNTILLLLRSETESDPKTWGIPGGRIEQGETPGKAARRETIEEIRVFPRGKIIDKLENNNFTIFIMSIPLEEKNRINELIRINSEHKSANWFPIGKMPMNLHPAIEIIRT